MTQSVESRRRLGAPQVRAAVAAALIFAVVGGCAVGVVRYVAEREHRAALLTEIATSAEAAAQRLAAQGPEAVAAALADAAAVSVVTPGKTDAFGISRGAEVAVDLTRDPRMAPADAEAHRRALLARNAELASAPDAAAQRRFEQVEVPDALFASAVAPAVADGRYLGMVRVVVELRPGEPAISMARFGAAVALALLLALALLFATGNVRLAGAAGGAAGTLVALGLTAFAGWTALAAAGAAALATRPLAGLLHGLRTQPGTYLYVAPAILSMVVLVFIPFAMGVGLSFFDSRGEPVGLANFIEILSPPATADTTFYWTFGVTVLWTVTNVVLHVSIGLGLALLLNRPDLRFKGVYRVLLIVPWAVPNYITALIWKWMFNTQYGAVNAFLALFGLDGVDWLGQSFATNFAANLITNTWLGFPFMMVVALGALQSIPKDLYEAAHIDGASRLQAFRHVTLPLLKPALVPAIILGSVWTFNMFNVIYLVSGGGPDNQTNILITEAYHAFKVLGRSGFAAAYSLLIFFILLAYGWMTNRVTKATEGAYE